MRGIDVKIIEKTLEKVQCPQQGVALICFATIHR